MAELESCRKHRAFHRRQVTALEGEIYGILQQDQWDSDEVMAKLARLNEAATKIEGFNDQIIHMMIDRDEPQEDVDQEQSGIGEYQDKVFKINAHIKRLTEGSSSSTEEIGAQNGSTVNKSASLKLPKLEIRKYCGKLEDWLPWWAQFKSIHESTALTKVEKFQYLVQSLVEGTRAAEAVNVYHCTEENYEKAIQALKDRCGKEDAITDMLMREIVQLVTSRQRMTLTELYDRLEGKLHSLESLGRKTKSDCDILYPMLEASLSEELLRTWKRVQDRYKSDSVINGECFTKLELLMKFLKAEAQREDEIAMTLATVKCTVRDKKRKVEVFEEESIPTAAGLTTAARVVTFNSKKPANTNCVFCDKPHQSKDCYTAPKLTYEERKQKLIKAKCCFLCFRKNHLSFNCRDKSRCQSCLGRHHVVMCPKGRVSKNDKKKGYNSDEAKALTSTSCLSTSKSTRVLKEVPLQTVKVKVLGPGGKNRTVRAVLDPGAQKSAILKSTAGCLKLPISHSVILGHFLYSGQQTDFAEHKVYRTEIKSLDGSFGLELNLIDESTILAGAPTVKLAEVPLELQLLKISLADCDTPDEIELLLGNDVYGKLLTGRIQHTDVGITAIETRFGWVISGESNAEPSSQTLTTSMMSVLNIKQLWDLDTLGIRDPVETKSKKELEEDIKFHFLQTLTVNEEGRYQVQLPWMMPKSNVMNNWNQALRRLATMTKKLRDSGYYEAYHEVFMEWLREGVIEEVKPEQINKSAAHYLPHRAIIKLESSTTKIRPVFDASCKLAKSLSLNDCLAKGPNQLERIPDILIRFRLRAIGAIADIRKAFLMIAVDPVDRDYLRFLWWEKDGTTVKVLRHQRVVFGVSCSPFQLAAVIEHHLLKDQSDVAMSLLSSFYVDNCVTSLDNVEDYHQFRSKSVKLMEKAKMDLRCWETNLDENNSGETSKSNVLGLTWDKKIDALTPTLTNLVIPDIVTKRTILAMAHSIFDPLGMFTPVCLEPKFCLREACLAKLSWDEEVPSEISSRFLKWCRDLKYLACITLPRRIAEVPPEEGDWSLHVFTDASRDAYAAAAFLRVQLGKRVTVTLLQSKARLAPQKATIPRLELLACLIGARLANSIKAGAKQEWKTILWTDSMTALTWIRRSDNWGTFVNNRVQEIRKITSSDEWRHVPGVLNYADLPSRGCSVKKFVESKWWIGPEWLLLRPQEWPIENVKAKEMEVAEERKKTVACATTEAKGAWYLPTNNYSRNVRIIAWIRRWLSRKHSGDSFDPEELEMAEKCIWRIVQSEANVESKAGLPLIKNKDGLMCVKLKIILREDAESFLMPVYLPNDHPITEQLIISVHKKNCHAGPQICAVKMREFAWIPNSKKIIHKALSKCTTCKRYGGRAFSCNQPPLPKERVSDGRVFHTTGEDLGGPLYLVDGSKAWFALFTCAVYRGIHLELLQSLSTEAFIQALRRFIARRGRPEIIYSDRGTNFTGLETLMEKLDWKKIDDEFSCYRIRWRFNPASAPWWGGWWERLIGLVKRLMRRIFGKGKLNQEELETSLCDIESVINSRPLTFVSEDPGELIPLTPAMFMTDAVNIAVPDIDEIERCMFQRRFRYRQQLRDELRRRFRAEYLANLLNHSNGKKHNEVQVGQIVMIGSDNKKRMDWPLAKVMEKIPGRDGIHRLVKLKTANGELLRPIQRIYPLEIESIPAARESDGQENGNLQEKRVNVEAGYTGAIDAKPEVEEEKKPEKRTRSGRVIRAPERLTYNLAGWNIVE